MRTAIALAALTAPMVLAGAPVLIRPDSATALSEFSGSYDIGNAIDGSGMPAGFNAGDLHGTYVQNNHWTTRSNALPNGLAVATFSFDTPQNLGRFHMWNHRSNGVASDPNYAIRRFDLTFRDAAGTPLLELTDLEAEGNRADQQLYCFDEVIGVSSVTLTIRENNGSIYTGLAEVAFGDASVAQCPGDADYDNDVDLADLNALLANFAQPIAPCAPADTNADGVLDLTDLNYILANFGTSCD